MFPLKQLSDLAVAAEQAQESQDSFGNNYSIQERPPIPIKPTPAPISPVLRLPCKCHSLPPQEDPFWDLVWSYNEWKGQWVAPPPLVPEVLPSELKVAEGGKANKRKGHGRKRGTLFPKGYKCGECHMPGHTRKTCKVAMLHRGRFTPGPYTCSVCGNKGHTKRSCPHKKD